MGIRALFFDFDGVLWDSEVASFRAWQETFATFDEDYLLEEFVTRIGAIGSPDPLEELERRLGRSVDRPSVHAT